MDKVKITCTSASKYKKKIIPTALYIILHLYSSAAVSCVLILKMEHSVPVLLLQGHYVLQLLLMYGLSGSSSLEPTTLKLNHKLKNPSQYFILKD